MLFMIMNSPPFRGHLKDVGDKTLKELGLGVSGVFTAPRNSSVVCIHVSSLYVSCLPLLAVQRVASNANQTDQRGGSGG